jgi:hypothetical protein
LRASPRAAGGTDRRHGHRQDVGQAETVDGVGVAAADLHDPVLAAGVRQPADLGGHLPDEARIAVFVDVLHEVHPA